ncbi:hypothetical protein CGLO_07217 [Colletotrichum gloeosporioides Cg-14]|uniref:Uncharacterized protein n=1 Tax=Colletotrichum gloeosporioides (strain Cg-14) TaxID=1237896 RepID=T0LN16_COLGC|nr:hypothetical protein CGLO_07217 [Colletotrichum gloeosporioides Cg-14]
MNMRNKVLMVVSDLKIHKALV